MLKEELVWLVWPWYKWNHSVCDPRLQPSFCSMLFARFVPLLSIAARHSCSVLYRPDCVNVPFIHSTFVGHLDSFQFWASINGAGSYTRVCGFRWEETHAFLVDVQRGMWFLVTGDACVQWYLILAAFRVAVPDHTSPSWMGESQWFHTLANTRHSPSFQFSHFVGVPSLECHCISLINLCFNLYLHSFFSLMSVEHLFIHLLSFVYLS